MAAATLTAERIEDLAVPAPRVRKISRPARALPVLRLVPGADALLHPRAAEALVLAYRPLSRSR